MKMKYYSIRVNERIDTDLKMISEKTGLDRSKLIRVMIRDGIKKYQKKEKSTVLNDVFTGEKE